MLELWHGNTSPASRPLPCTRHVTQLVSSVSDFSASAFHNSHKQREYNACSIWVGSIRHILPTSHQTAIFTCRAWTYTTSTYMDWYSSRATGMFVEIVLVSGISDTVVSSYPSSAWKPRCEAHGAFHRLTHLLSINIPHDRDLRASFWLQIVRIYPRFLLLDRFSFSTTLLSLRAGNCQFTSVHILKTHFSRRASCGIDCVRPVDFSATSMVPLQREHKIAKDSII